MDLPSTIQGQSSRIWWPMCARCRKMVDHVELLGDPGCVRRYRVRCHGQMEEHIIGIWAASEYIAGGRGLPDVFKTNEETIDV